MNYRKYITPIDELIEKGKSISEATDDAKYQHKVELVTLMVSGVPASYLSQYVSESQNTLIRWVKTADEKGFEALQINRNNVGRPTKITEDIAAKIDAALQDDPHNYGYNVWDGPSLSKYIKSQYGIEYSVRQCQRLFRDLGYNLKRGQMFPCKDENDPRREEFKKNNGKSGR